MAESYSWRAPAFHHHEKEPAWYTWSIVIAALVAILAIVQGNILFLIFVVVAEAVILYRGRRKPTMFDYTIVHEGIEERRGEDVLSIKFIAFNDYLGFALFDDPFTPRHSEVIFKPKSKAKPYRKILIPADGLDEMKEFLAPRLREFHYEEKLIEHLVKRLKL